MLFSKTKNKGKNMSFFSKMYEYMCAPAGTYSSDLFEATNDDVFCADNSITVINPATGLPMTGGIGGIDVAGNPYGVDGGQENHDMFDSNSTSMVDDVCSATTFDNDCTLPIIDANCGMDSCFDIKNSDSIFD